MNKTADRSARRKKVNRDRFVRIAENRVNRILNALDSLGNCSNRRNYDYSDTDVKKIFSEIEKKLKETRSMFQATAENKKRFTLR
jgi:hypothetical protein